MNEATTNHRPQGIARFTKHMILGAIFGGVLCAMPILGCLNCLFCILNIAGVVFALWMYLKACPEDAITTGESCGFGAIAGAGSGLISSVLTILVNLLLKDKVDAVISDWIAQIPGAADLVAQQASLGALGLAGGVLAMIGTTFFTIVLFAAFGLLGSFLAMKLFFKSRIRTS
jgi:hypothetical protein